MNKKIFLGAFLFASLIAVPVFADTGSTTPSAVQPIDLACVQTAVDVREGATADAFTAFTTAENAALAARKPALHDAWGMTNAKERRTARNKAWSDFQTANRAAYKVLRATKKSIWGTFSDASRSCHASVVESHGVEGVGSLGL